MNLEHLQQEDYQIDVNTIDNNIFRPINISPDIRRAFAEKRC